MKRYIVIEIFDPNYPVIVTDSNGNPMIFESKQEAEYEASECQHGIIVEY